jgi:hypothetical protein
VIALGDLPKWLRLFRVAHALIEQVNSPQLTIDRWISGLKFNLTIIEVTVLAR